MKTVKNKSQKALKIHLPRGKSLFLGVAHSAQVRDEALEHGPVKKLIEAGAIEVIDGTSKRGDGIPEDSAHPYGGARGNLKNR